MFFHKKCKWLTRVIIGENVWFTLKDSGENNQTTLFIFEKNNDYFLGTFEFDSVIVDYVLYILLKIDHNTKT